LPGSDLANLGTPRQGKLLKLESELLNALREAVIATDLDGYIIFWNPSAERLFGWNADEVVGRRILDVTQSPNSRLSAVAIFDQLTEGGWSGQFEKRHKDGHWVLVDVTNSPVRDQQGNLIAIVGLSRAIETTKMPSEPPNDAAAWLSNQMLTNIASRFRGLTSAGRISRVRGFGIAIVLFGLALVARELLDQIFPQRLPFISFFPAVLLAGFVCGPWPTLVLLLASGITGALWGAPYGINSLALKLVAGAIFVTLGVIAVAPVFYATSVHRRLQRNAERLSLINGELKHRVKNLFAITSSICLQTIKSDLPREALASAIAARIKAIASAQDLVTAMDEGSDLRALIEAVVMPISPDASRLQITGPPVSLPLEATTPFALILHELATNAVKYGAWASTQGRTVIEWQLPTERHLEFHWREENVLLSTGPHREGFGSVIIKRALGQAKVRHEIGPKGADCIIELPI
jgi:PAS domain S-box-containing protein